MNKVTKNTFERALNTYTDEQALEPGYYTEAHNITLTADHKFYGPTNIQGTLYLANASGTVAFTTANVKAVHAKFVIGTETDVPCLVYFVAGEQFDGDEAMHIIAQRLDTNVIFYLYESVIDNYLSPSRLFDARVYPENGVDYIYFTDYFNELRQLRCEIPTGAADNFLTDYDLSLQRRGANGAVTLNDVVTGGSLLSGTYQYAYRMVDPANKRYTKWSSLSAPIHVYGSNNSSDPVYSSVGLPTQFAIEVDITPSPEEAAHFEYYQLAAVENVYGVTTTTQPAALLPVTAFTGTSVTFTHSANQKVGLIPITDIVVDLAAIQTAKTLAIKQNRLFAGNIKYHSLEFDNGDPVVTAGGILVTVTSDNDAYSNHELSSTRVGYFRDEVYRFGIVYKDKYGNRAPVKVLDLNALTGNQISGTLPDFKFPPRSTNTYSLLDSSTKVKILGLDLTIDNHPTWAVGFEIVRAKRKKRILFQTPVIPMTYVEGIGALGGYPSVAETSAGATEYPGAQPQKQSRVYLPKNLFWPELRYISRRETDGAGTAENFAGVGEAILRTMVVAQQPPYSVIFPPETMYGPAPYKFTRSEKVETVDYTIARAWVSDFEVGAHEPGGEHIDTKLSGTFYSLSQGNYYFDAGQTGKTVFEDPVHIKDSVYIENGSLGTVFGGNKIMTYSDLSGEGINWGFEPQPQRCVVIETAGVLPDVITNTNTTLGGGTGPLSFLSGVLNEWTGVGGSTYIVGASGPQYQPSGEVTNEFINEYSGYSNNSSYVQAFRIANIVNDLGDERYGAVDTQHEFVSTGASYTFSEIELATVQAGTTLNVQLSVYGGDCFISAHTFKLADSWYSVTNQSKNNSTLPADDPDLIEHWGRYYQNAGSTAGLCVPVALEGASQFIQVILESEYNGGVMGEDILWPVVSANGFPVMNLSSSFNTAGSLRSPLLYNYNNNLSKQNDQKIYFPLATINSVQNNFKARVAYSDIKIYESDVQGFDVFRFGNIYDLEESRGALTKLAIASDDMYAVQEAGIMWLPTGQSQLQQTDAGILAVGTGDVIGRPIVLQQNRGGQHLRGIVETGDTVFVPDARNQTVYKLADRQFVTIDVSSNIFADPIAESDVVGFYDPLAHEYYLSDTENDTCYVYNEFIEKGTWVGNIEFNSDAVKLKEGIWCNNRFYAVSHEEDEVLQSWALYEGDYNSLFGTVVTPRMSFVVNPESDIAKTFDDVMIVSDQRLDEIRATVERETAQSNQSFTTTLDVLAVEGGYRIKTLRDSASARLRGPRMGVELTWKTGPDDVATVSSVLTKYRLSARTPF